MKESYGFRSTKKIDRLLADGKKRTGLNASYLIRAGIEEGLPIVMSRFIGAKQSTGKKI